MSNSNTANPPLFNNNKSLYGTRTQTNQSSKKISIIEDKATLEPVRPFPSSLNASTTPPNSSFQRYASSELSSSQLHKQIQIQKQALNAINLDQMHQNVYHQLDEWKNMMYNRVDSMKSRMLEENAQSHNQLISLQSVMKNLLEEEIIKQLLLLKTNSQMINDQELDEIEQRLERVNAEIEFMKRCDVQLDSSNTQIVGDIQLHKMTDFSKHQPLPQPPPSPPPSSVPPTVFSQLSTTITDEKELDQTPTASELTASKPIPPVWTDATRQGLNSLSHYLPFRLLIPNNVREKLIDSFDIEHFDSELALSRESPIESILTIINQDDLDVSVEILNDLMVAFQCSSNQYELRLLYPKKFIPIITGKRNERLDRLKDKYQLDMMKIFPQACPLSDERVILLRCQYADYIIYCLREVIQNILEQGHFDNEDQSYAMYNPSENYDESSAHEYGGYKSNDICEVTLAADDNNNDASVEDLTETKQRSAASAHSSSSSSLTKHRHNSEDTPLNYDDTEPESDDDDDNDDSKRSQSSEDKRIFVKKLNTVKGRQVGLLIGPFGQHITQIREQTGAKIHLTNDDNEPSVIKGTKSQINQALRLIRECLQTQKPIPRTAFKGGRRR